jgi:hypothetical protein
LGFPKVASTNRLKHTQNKANKFKKKKQQQQQQQLQRRKEKKKKEGRKKRKVLLCDVCVQVTTFPCSNLPPF